MSKVSVIIPTYNEGKAIAECINSLFKQTIRDLEIIVVDDGSSDNTLEIISQLEEGKYKILVLKQLHKGPGAARNLGAKKAKGEILVFVDADMTFYKNFIQKLVNPIIQGSAKGTFSKEEYVSNWNNTWAQCWSINEGWEERERHPKDYPDEDRVFRAILKSEFEKVGGFTPGGYTDDYSLYEKLGYKSKNAKVARFFHKNPDNLVEIFKQAKWAAKREYKLGIIGYLIGIIRASLPVSLLVGFIKSVINLKSAFLIFKLVYDLGIFIGIIEYSLFGKRAK